MSRTYGECQAERLGTPANRCDRTSCRHHVESDERSSVRMGPRENQPPRDGYSCALAFVDDHPDGALLCEVGAVLGVGVERARQIEYAALRRMERRAAMLDPAAPPPPTPPRPRLVTFSVPERPPAGRTLARDIAMRMALCGRVTGDAE